MMLRAGVVGWPVSHSLSPRLHGYWLKKYGIPGEYSAFSVTSGGLPAFIEGLRAQADMRGVNLTIPHKEAVIPLLDEVDELAKHIGAVNTLVVKNGKLHGSNTDVYGFAENIRPFVQGTRKAVVLGAGGAAKAICWALQEFGFSRIVVMNRTEARAQELVEQIGGNLAVQRWQERSIALGGTDLLVNTTSLGLKNSDALDIDLSSLPKHALVTDAVYVPLMTPLLVQAVARGNPVVDGLGMLLHQAVPGFEAWFGVKPEVTQELRDYVLEAPAE